MKNVGSFEINELGEVKELLRVSIILALRNLRKPEVLW